MDMLLTIFAVVNLLLSITVLVIVLSRRSAGGGEGSSRALEAVVREESQKQSGEIRREQQ